VTKVTAVTQKKKEKKGGEGEGTKKATKTDTKPK